MKRKILDFIMAFIGIVLIKTILSAVYAYIAVNVVESLKNYVNYFEVAFSLLTLIAIIYFWNKRRFFAWGLVVALVLIVLTVF